MTNDIEKKVGNTMMDDLIPGRKQKREAKEASDAAAARRQSYSSNYSNRDYGRGGYSSYGDYSNKYGDPRQGSLLDDDGPDPMDDRGGYSYGRSSGGYANSYKPETIEQKLEKLTYNWTPDFTATHGVIEQDTLEKISELISIQVGQNLDSANLTWRSASAARLRAIISQFILDECMMYSYSNLHGRGYKPVCLQDKDGVIHDDVEDKYADEKPVGA